MKEVGLILDLDQYPLHNEKSFKDLVSGFYIPLIKILKSYREQTLSLKISLNTLDLFERYGYDSLISDIRDMYQNEKIEIIGSFPFKLDLDDGSEGIIESRITLNEYGVGYYLGSRQGFEGEPSILLRDLKGFYPPKIETNNVLLGVLRNLGYRWVINKNIPEGLCEVSDGGICLIKTVDISSDLREKMGTGKALFNAGNEKILFSSFVDNLIGKLEAENIKTVVLNFEKTLWEEVSYNDTLRAVSLILEIFEKKNVAFSKVSDVLKNIKKPKVCKNITNSNESTIKTTDTQKKYYIILHSMLHIVTELQAKASELVNKNEFIPENMWNRNIISPKITDQYYTLSYLEYLIYELESILDYYSEYSKDILLDDGDFKDNLIEKILEIKNALDFINDDKERNNMRSLVAEIEDKVLSSIVQ